MKYFLMIVFAAVFLSASQSPAACMPDNFGTVFCSSTSQGSIAKDRFGDLVCGPGQCLTNNFDEIVCSKFNGGILVTDRFDQLLSSPGSCEKDNFGDFVCSSVAGGSVFKDNFGSYSCEGRCISPTKGAVTATSEQCRKLSH